MFIGCRGETVVALVADIRLSLAFVLQILSTMTVGSLMCIPLIDRPGSYIFIIDNQYLKPYSNNNNSLKSNLNDQNNFIYRNHVLQNIELMPYSR